MLRSPAQSQPASVRPARRAGCVLLASLMAMLPAGCHEPVLTPDEHRSQYDRFDAVRDQRAPSYYMNEYGQRKPNIRPRLVGGD